MSYFKTKMHQIRFRLGLRPTSHWGSLQRCPDPLARFKGPTSNEGEGRKGKRTGRGGKGKGGFAPPPHSGFLDPPLVKGVPNGTQQLRKLCHMAPTNQWCRQWCRVALRSSWLCKILPKSAQRCGNAAQKFQKFPLFGKESPSTGEPLIDF